MQYHEEEEEEKLLALLAPTTPGLTASGVDEAAEASVNDKFHDGDEKEEGKGEGGRQGVLTSKMSATKMALFPGGSTLTEWLMKRRWTVRAAMITRKRKKTCAGNADGFVSVEFNK